jgi:hypothetical protein
MQNQKPRHAVPPHIQLQQLQQQQQHQQFVMQRHKMVRPRFAATCHMPPAP